MAKPPPTPNSHAVATCPQARAEKEKSHARMRELEYAILTVLPRTGGGAKKKNAVFSAQVRRKGFIAACLTYPQQQTTGGVRRFNRLTIWVPVGSPGQEDNGARTVLFGLLSRVESGLRASGFSRANSCNPKNSTTAPFLLFPFVPFACCAATSKKKKKKREY